MQQAHYANALFTGQLPSTPYLAYNFINLLFSSASPNLVTAEQLSPPGALLSLSFAIATYFTVNLFFKIN